MIIKAPADKSEIDDYDYMLDLSLFIIKSY